MGNKGQSMARIYKVRIVLDAAGEVGKEYLVEAESPAQARTHVLRKVATVELASQRDVYELAKAGVSIENATDQASVEG